MEFEVLAGRSPDGGWPPVWRASSDALHVLMKARTQAERVRRPVGDDATVQTGGGVLVTAPARCARAILE